MLNNPTNSIRSSARLRVLTGFVVAVFAARSIAAQQVPPPGAPDGRDPTQSGVMNLPGAPGGPPPVAPPEEPPTEAERFIDGAIKKLAKVPSVTADMLQTIEMLNVKFTVNGRYLRAPKDRVKLQLTVEGLADGSGTSLQVCDGETLWEYQQILDKQYYRKLSIKPILERVNSADLDPKIKTLAITQMGLAGPELLLVGLRKTIKFDLMEDAELDGKKVVKIHGTWRNRQGLIGPDARPVSPMGVLPPYIPMDVTVYLGKEDSWPYKLELKGRAPSAVYDSRRLGPDGRVQGAKSSIEKIPQTLVVIVYSNVKLGGTIPDDEFAFQAPANATVDDNTEDLIKGLDRELDREAQKKRNEAAKKDGALIDQPINLPNPPGAANP